MALEEAKWYVAVGDETRGPMSGEAICDLLRRGVVDGSALVWRWDAKQSSALPLGILIEPERLEPSRMPSDSPSPNAPRHLWNCPGANGFPVLGIIWKVLAILGLVNIAVGLIGFIASLVGLVVSTRSAWGLLWSLGMVEGGFLLIAASEVIRVILAIEGNTRRAAESTTAGK